MNRHFARIVAMQSLYEWDFRHDGNPISIFNRNCKNLDTPVDQDFAKCLIKLFLDHQGEIDELIGKAAPEWPFEQIALIDRNILRIGVAELLFDKEIPPKVAINESIELAKIYGGDNSSKFVNGVMGNIYRQSDRYVKDEDKKTEQK